jgi:hypothetical protein
MNAPDLTRALTAADLTEETVMAMPLAAAKLELASMRARHGFLPVARPLLTAPDGNVKLTHSETDRVYAYGLSLSPAGSSGWQVCRYRTDGCEAVCLATSGKGAFGKTQRARVWKTQLLAESPVAFLRVLASEIDAVGSKVPAKAAAGWTVSLRLNVLSDLPWETIAPWILTRAAAAGIRCYDYTKWPTARRAAAMTLGYDLSESVTERSSDVEILTARRPVVVFSTRRGQSLPASYLGRTVVDGDRSDARFMDPAGCVVGLRFKQVTTGTVADGLASGFVRAA